jgi:hypothetical protein
MVCGNAVTGMRGWAWRAYVDVELVGADVDVDPAVCWLEGAALAGAATVRAVPARATSPNTEAAAAPARRILIM